ncbi:MAG TPA: methyltransferase domain-containing protein, partial [Candidatus Glassbacteria bacterium]|nr:methyltransferase domain-containing protein [Candidatus Glassbacteria bacterium]
MKIELASGERPHNGYLHCDMRLLENTDLICRVETLPFADGSVESLLASHIIEHFSYREIDRVLAEWHRVLRRGGELLIITPNFAYIAHGYVDGWMQYTEARNRMFGGQDYTGNYHYTMFDSAAMSAVMTETGFKNVKDVTSHYENRKVPMSLY